MSAQFDSLIKASELKEGDIVYRTGNLPFVVVTNIIDDVLFVHLDNMDKYIGHHLFYGDLQDVVFAKEAFGIDLI